MPLPHSILFRQEPDGLSVCTRPDGSFIITDANGEAPCGCGGGGGTCAGCECCGFDQVCSFAAATPTSASEIQVSINVTIEIRPRGIPPYTLVGNYVGAMFGIGCNTWASDFFEVKDATHSHTAQAVYSARATGVGSPSVGAQMQIGRVGGGASAWSATWRANGPNSYWSIGVGTTVGTSENPSGTTPAGVEFSSSGSTTAPCATGSAAHLDTSTNVPDSSSYDISFSIGTELLPCPSPADSAKPPCEGCGDRILEE